MKTKGIFLLTGIALIAGIALFTSTSRVAASAHDGEDGEDSNQRFVVDNHTRGRCPGANFTSIQQAVVAAPPGATIQVCPGNYPEQVSIKKPLTIVGIEFNNQKQIIIDPPVVAPTSTSLFSGNPIAPIVLADSTHGVNLINLTVDGGNGGGITGCGPNFIGIFYRNASGTINSTAVRNIRLTPSLAGCQSGDAIFVQSGHGGSSKVLIVGNSVHDYQKNGITGNEVGTEITVAGNAVNGIGSTEAIAQNGIQVAFGAKAEIKKNVVTNHIYALCTSVANCSFSSTDILIFESDGVEVEANVVVKSQGNIFAQGNKTKITGNASSNADVFDGIGIMGDGNTVTSNLIFKSDESGIFVEGNNNTVEKNTINEAPIGILEQAPSSNNDIDNNNFFNTAIKGQPASVGFAPVSGNSLTSAVVNNFGRSAQPVR